MKGRRHAFDRLDQVRRDGFSRHDDDLHGVIVPIIVQTGRMPAAVGEPVLLRRYLQYVVDTAIVTVAILALLTVGVVCGVLMGLATGQSVWLKVTLAVFFLPGVWLAWWLHVRYPHRHDGSTPAMRLLGLRIVRTDGGPPARRDYILRWLLMVVDGMFFGLVGAVLMLVSPRRQRLGDMVTDTMVVRRVS